MTIGLVVDHLWQSSCFAVLAALLAFALRKNSPAVRYRVWLTASLKFLVPFALLVSLGGTVPRPARPVASSSAVAFPVAVVEIAEPFALPAYSAAPAHSTFPWPAALGVAWALGFLVIALLRCRGWLRVRAALRAGRPIQLPIPVQALITPAAQEPGVVGFLRPVLILPAKLLEHLTPRQLSAVLTHEMCHVRRRDNLFSAVHMLVEAIFWFHPLVWWIGSRLIEERELARDEEVLRAGTEPADYVEGILKVCRLGTESPLPCVSGVTSADVKKRLRAILAGSVARELTMGKRVVLAAAALTAVAGPVFLGALSAPQARAQADAQSAAPVVPAGPSKVVRPLLAQVSPAKGGTAQTARRTEQPIAEPLQFEVASVRPSGPPSGRSSDPIQDLMNRPTTNGGPETSDPENLTIRRTPLRWLLWTAYGVHADQISGPDWIDTDIFDITAKIPPGATKEQADLMLRNLLLNRFKITLHHETKEDTLSYALSVAKNGSKMKEASLGEATPDPELPPRKPSDFLSVNHDADGFPVIPPGRTGIVATRDAAGLYSMTCRACTVAEFIRRITPDLGGVGKGYAIAARIADKTNLMGKYDFHLAYLGGGVVGGALQPPSLDGQVQVGPDIFNAVEKQLGLTLEKIKAPLDVLVIDHIDRVPEDN